jgi:hypothetical protein
MIDYLFFGMERTVGYDGIAGPLLYGLWGVEQQRDG